jgi:branched-chain amino acid transport system substrate-binding protein
MQKSDAVVMPRSVTAPRRLLAVVPLCILLMSLPTCGSDESSAELWIAAAGQWHDSSAVDYRRGVEMAVDEVNRAGGINGRTLRVRYEEDGYTRDDSRIVQSASELVADARILAVIGHGRSLPTIGAAPHYRGRLALVSPFTELPPGLQSEWAVSLQIPDTLVAAEAARLAVRQGWSTAVLIADNSPRGRVMATDFEERFAGQVLRKHPIFTVRIMGDYMPEAEFVRQANPDVVLFMTTTPTAVHLFDALDAVGIAPLVLVLVADLPTPVADGVMLITTLPPGGESAEPTAPAGFHERYLHRFGAPPMADAALAHDAVSVVAAALRTGARTRAQVAEALLDVAVEGTTGMLDFDAGGRRTTARLHAVQVVGGDLVPIR